MINNINCPNCEKELSEKSLFCGKCKTQVKCSECKENLAPDDLCCEFCGTDIKKISESNPVMNRIKYDGKSFEAEFTDTVCKDVTETLGNIFATRQLALQNNTNNSIENTGNQKFKESYVEDIEYASIEETVDAKKPEVTLTPNDIPTLQSIAMKNLPTNEAEWIVVYSFYASKYGKEVFNRKDIWNLYEITNRKTLNRRKGLSSYIKSVVKANNINPLNDDGDFTMLESGIKRAKEIFSRTSGKSVKKTNSKSSSTKDKTSTKTTSAQVLKLVSNLNLHPKGKQSLKDFYNLFKLNSNLEKNLVFVHYLEKILQEDNRSLDHIYTCYKKVGERIPKNLYQSLQDTRKLKAWIDTSNVSKLSITTNGENAIEHDLKRK